jgi:cytochrome c oxidase subunit II
MMFRLVAISALLMTTAMFLSERDAARTPVIAGDLEQAPAVHDITVRARRYEFSPARIAVNQGDILSITLIAEDVPHSFTIDEYRISKRVSPDRSVTFDLCADKRGRFVYYCSLTADERCREMRGELHVR